MDYAQPALNYIQPALNRALNLSTKLWQSEERKWLISFKNPVLVLKDNPTFLMLELVTILWAFLLYKHGTCIASISIINIKKYKLGMHMHA